MSVHQFSATLMNGEKKSIEDYKGKVLLIVNTATKCGFAPQFEGLQALYDNHQSEGFEVLGFPSNQFKNQEPGTNEETAEACKVNFGVNFPLFQKIKVNGEDAHPLFIYLTEQKKGIGTAAIKWNFTKFLIDQNGKVVKRYAPTTTPKKIEADMANLLK